MQESKEQITKVASFFFKMYQFFFICVKNVFLQNAFIPDYLILTIPASIASNVSSLVILNRWKFIRPLHIFCNLRMPK